MDDREAAGLKFVLGALLVLIGLIALVVNPGDAGFYWYAVATGSLVLGVARVLSASMELRRAFR